MELFKLFGTIAINNNEANSALQNTSGEAEKAGASLSGMIATAGKWAAAITGAAIAAGGAVLGFASSVADTTDHIDKMSQKIGISRQAYQELDFVLSQSGTSVDNLQQGVKSLTTAMDQVADGSESATANFARLGVEVLNADGSFRSQEDVLWDTLSALQGVENQTEKARLATELFGRSGIELMPLLNGATGSIDEMRQKAQELGLVINDETIDAGVRLTDTMDQTKRAFKAVATSVGATLLPIVQRAFEKILEKLPEISAAVADVVSWVQNSIEWCEQHQTVIEILAIVVGTLTAAIIAYNIAQNALAIVTAIATAASTGFGVVMAFLTSPITLVILAIGALIAIGVLLVKNWDTIKEKCSEIAGNIADRFNAIKASVSATLENIKTVVENVFESVKSKIKSKMDVALSTVKGIVEKIKNAFNFEWTLPHFKLPHVSVSGGVAPYGIGGQGSLPQFSVQWYAKGGILQEPTIFGMMGDQFLGGGEAGKEAVAPIDTLQTYVEEAVAKQNAGLSVVLEKILDAVESMDEHMGGNMREALDGTSLTVNNREFARLVRGAL